MAQHDYDIANADGATVRADINSVLEAIASANVGATAPPVTFPHMLWVDSSTNIVKRRNAANTAWTDWLALDASGNLVAMIDGVRKNVASATTVNLTTLSNDSNHINITGTTTITGFTVAAGRCHFVRFDASLTLTNSASLVIQSGANIVTKAGDTCIIRATAANTVEVLMYTRAIVEEIGVGQTWQNVTGSRSAGVTYTNTTNKPIMIAPQTIASAAGGYSTDIVIDGLLIHQLNRYAESASRKAEGCYIVPVNSTYKIDNLVNCTLDTWKELR